MGHIFNAGIFVDIAYDKILASNRSAPPPSRKHTKSGLVCGRGGVLYGGPKRPCTMLDAVSI